MKLALKLIIDKNRMKIIPMFAYKFLLQFKTKQKHKVKKNLLSKLY